MRILLITDMMPYPPISGTPLRTYNLLQRVAGDHEVWVATFVGTPEEAEGVSRLLAFCQGVLTAKKPGLGALARPVDIGRYLVAGKPPELRLSYSEELAQKIQHLVSEKQFDVVQMQNSNMGIYLETLPEMLHSRALLEFIDVAFRKFDRISRLEPKPARRLRMWFHSQLMRRWEPRYAERFNRCVTVSEVDKELLLAFNPSLQIEVIPNGIDVRQYQPLPETSMGLALVFVGNMDYRPNIDAMLYFCQEVLPRIRHVVPKIEMWIVGINPGHEVRHLDGSGIHVTGRVDDVRPYYERSTVCVIPLRAGGGTRLKILEAMALNRPVVSTAIGCEGLDVVGGEHLLIADTPEKFAESIVQLVTDESLRGHLINKARQLVVTRYDWDVIAQKLVRVYAEIAEQA